MASINCNQPLIPGPPALGKSSCPYLMSLEPPSGLHLFAVMFWKLMLAAPLIDLTSDFLISGIFRAPRQLVCISGQWAGVFHAAPQPFPICHPPRWHQGGQLVQTDWSGVLFVKVLGCSKGEREVTLGTGTAWSHLAWDTLEQVPLVINDVFLQGWVLSERSRRTLWWSWWSF